MTLILFNLIFFVYTLFSFFLIFELGFSGFLLNLIVLIVYAITSLILILLFAIKGKQKRKIYIQIISLILIIFCSQLNMKMNIPEKITLAIKIPIIKKEIREYEASGKINNRIRLEGEFIAYVWDPGFLDIWDAIVYSPDNQLDEAVVLYKSGKSEEFRTYRYLLGGGLDSIQKIDDSFYLCHFD